MEFVWGAVALVLLLATIPVHAQADGAGEGRPVVGAIRWDGWTAGSEWGANLSPAQWRSRLPFYGRVISDDRVEIRGDTQEVMDREIVYASGAGLDYWAFCYYHPRSWEGADRYNYGWKLYLSSEMKTKLNFCLILQASVHLGPVGEWPDTVAHFVRLFRDPSYQTVAGGRPLVYLLRSNGMDEHFGSHAAAREAIRELRQQCLAAGLPTPYLVAQAHSPAQGAEFLEGYGFDAVGAYTASGWGEHREYPYSALARANRDFWDGCKATGNKVIPLVNAGWDPRPRLGDERHANIYGPTPWYAQPTPSELADHLQSALDWVKQNSAVADAQCLLIYAWNESDEGGWLVPTHGEGTARLDAIGGVLRPASR